MRDMARIQAFLEGMDEYRKVVEAFLNCTPFMGYVWVCRHASQEEPSSSNHYARDQSGSYSSYESPASIKRINVTPHDTDFVQATNTWVTSLDVILNAYQQIQERLPSFMQYQVLFDKNPEMRRALELYFCDILEFHYNALRFLTRPGEETHLP